MDKNQEFYEGDDVFEQGTYEFVAQVELPDRSYVKLPFNSFDNETIVTEKFCKLYNVPLDHFSEILDFIRQTKAQAQKSKTHSDELPEAPLSVPTKPTVLEQAKIQINSTVSFLNINSFCKACEVIEKMSDVIDVNNRRRLVSLAQDVRENPKQKLSAKRYNTCLIDAFFSKNNYLTKMDRSQILPFLDVMAIMVLSDDVFEIFFFTDTFLSTVNQVYCLISPPWGNVPLLAARFLANLSRHAQTVSKLLQLDLSKLKTYTDIPEKTRSSIKGFISNLLFYLSKEENNCVTPIDTTKINMLIELYKHF